MSNLPASTSQLADEIEAALVNNDLSKLSVEQRIEYYNRVCQSVGLNPMTQPFRYIVLNQRLTLYAKRDATDQLRKIHGVSVVRLEKETNFELGIYAVTAHAQDRDGRTDSAIGAVSVLGMKGESLANAMMKAETKAKRRVTLSICGLGWLDETETETIPGAVIVDNPAVRDLDWAQNVKSPGGKAFSTLTDAQLGVVAENTDGKFDAYQVEAAKIILKSKGADNA